MTNAKFSRLAMFFFLWRGYPFFWLVLVVLEEN